MTTDVISDILMITGLGIDLVGFLILFWTRGRTPGYLSLEAHEREQERIERLNGRIEHWTAWGFGLVVVGIVLQVAGASLGAAWR